MGLSHQEGRGGDARWLCDSWEARILDPSTARYTSRQYLNSISFTVEQSSREHIVNQNSYLRKAALCSPTTQTLQANFKPWPPLQVQKSPGTTGLSRWTHSAPWSLANFKSQPTTMEKDVDKTDHIKLWEHHIKLWEHQQR